jgi:hypothetical protein
MNGNSRTKSPPKKINNETTDNKPIKSRKGHGQPTHVVSSRRGRIYKAEDEYERQMSEGKREKIRNKPMRENTKG